LAHNCCIGAIGPSITWVPVVSAIAVNGRFRFIHWMPMRNLMGHSPGTSGSRSIIPRCTLGGAEQGVDAARKFREQAATLLFPMWPCAGRQCRRPIRRS
jgi:hypothetical protein